MHSRIAQLLGVSAVRVLGPGAGIPQLGPPGEDAALAQGGRSRGYSDWSIEVNATTNPAPGKTPSMTASSHPNAAAVREAAAWALAKALAPRVPERRAVSPSLRTPPPPK